MNTVHLCELPPQQATRAALSPNTARNHHYIAQTEQRQHAFNPEVNANNQNVYRLAKNAWFDAKAVCQSVNIDHNLSAPNLYTLAELRDGQQYNLENWFVRYEGRFERDCEVAKQLPEGEHVLTEEVVRILKLKWLSLLRNPLNADHFIVRHLSTAWQSGLAQYAKTLEPHILERDDEARHKLAKQFGFTDKGYISWLSFIFALLSDAVATPSWFERISDLLIRHPAVRIEMLRQSDAYTVFADTGFALQASQQQLSIGFSIDAHHWLICHIPEEHWQDLSNCWCTSLPENQPQRIKVFNAEQQQAHVFNLFMHRSAQRYVYTQAHKRSLLA